MSRAYPVNLDGRFEKGHYHENGRFVERPQNTLSICVSLGKTHVRGTEAMFGTYSQDIGASSQTECSGSISGKATHPESRGFQNHSLLYVEIDARRCCLDIVNGEMVVQVRP